VYLSLGLARVRPRREGQGGPRPQKGAGAVWATSLAMNLSFACAGPPLRRRVRRHATTANRTPLSVTRILVRISLRDFRRHVAPD